MSSKTVGTTEMLRITRQDLALKDSLQRSVAPYFNFSALDAAERYRLEVMDSTDFAEAMLKKLGLPKTRYPAEALSAWVAGVKDRPALNSRPNPWLLESRTVSGGTMDGARGDSFIDRYIYGE